MLLRVGDKVKDNISSMLQDILAGKQTEVREFNGWFVETARYLGEVDTTNHEIIMSLVEDAVTLEEPDLARYFSVGGSKV